MENRACSTCKERKIACDRTCPICQNCVRSKRPCRRYNIRLSWPKENDQKRALLGPSRSFFRSEGISTHFKFINTSTRDVEMYRLLLDPSVLHNTQHLQFIGAYILPPTLSISNYPSFECDEAELIPYCEFWDCGHLSVLCANKGVFSIVLPSLPAFGIDLEKLRSVVARLAIHDDSAPSRAVLSSLLALASLYKLGNQRQATKFIATALNALRVSAQEGIRLQQGLQHIVAGMLICSFEIYLFSRSSSLWLLYLSGTKGIIAQFYGRNLSEDEDQSLLFQWVFYYDTLARLGIKHWTGRSLQSQLEKEIGFSRGNSWYTADEITEFGGCAHKAVELLSQFCVGALTPDDPNHCAPEYISWLTQIESQLSSIRRELQQHSSPHDLGTQSESVAVKELFVLATLVYFERKSKQLVGASAKTDEWIEDGFLILSKLEYCNKLFPLFIFGREAHNDDKRLLILRIIDQTMEKANASSLASLRDLLVKIWVHMDLNEGNPEQHKNGCSIMHVHGFVQCLI